MLALREAYAANPVPGRVVNINVESPAPVNAQFLDTRGNSVLTVVLSGADQFQVPEFASKIQFEVRDYRSNVYSLPEHSGEKEWRSQRLSDG